MNGKLLTGSQETWVASSDYDDYTQIDTVPGIVLVV